MVTTTGKVIPLYSKEVREFTQEDAVQLALLLERQEQAIKLMKDKLKAYVSLNGKIETDEKVWDFVPAFTWDFSTEGKQNLAATLIAEGKNPFDYFNLGAKERDKLGYSEQDLSDFGTKKPTNPTFKAVKKQNI